MKHIETNIIDKDYSTITFDQLVKHLNLDADLVNVDDIESILKSSIDWIETRINSFITPTTLELSIYDFTGDTITIEHTGTTNIDSITIAGVPFTDFKLIKKYTSAYIILNQTVNSISDVKVNYLAGSKPAGNFIQAALINAADMYDVDRSNYSAGLSNNRTVLRLLNLE